MDASLIEQIPEKYREIYEKNWRTIKPRVQQGRIRDMYHFPLINSGNNEIFDKAEEVTGKYKGKIKVNAAFGFILKNRTTGDLKFYHPSNNTMLFTNPRLIEKRLDFRRFLDDIDEQGAFEYARKHRPSTNWTVERIICVRFDIYKLGLY